MASISAESCKSCEPTLLVTWLTIVNVKIERRLMKISPHMMFTLTPRLGTVVELRPISLIKSYKTSFKVIANTRAERHSSEIPSEIFPASCPIKCYSLSDVSASVGFPSCLGSR